MDEFLAGLAGHGDTIGIGIMLVGVLGFFFRQLARGALIFRAAVDAEIGRNIEYYDKLIALLKEQAQSWETAYRNEAIARADQGATLGEQLELARAANHMLKALPTSRPGGTAIGGEGENGSLPTQPNP